MYLYFLVLWMFPAFICFEIFSSFFAFLYYHMLIFAYVRSHFLFHFHSCTFPFSFFYLLWSSCYWNIIHIYWYTYFYLLIFIFNSFSHIIYFGRRRTTHCGAKYRALFNNFCYLYAFCILNCSIYNNFRSFIDFIKYSYMTFVISYFFPSLSNSLSTRVCQAFFCICK